MCIRDSFYIRLAKMGRNLRFVVFCVEKIVLRARYIEKSRKNDMVMAVSYTHLDVYKRQVQYFVMTMENGMQYL